MCHSIVRIERGSRIYRSGYIENDIYARNVLNRGQCNASEKSNTAYAARSTTTAARKYV